ncbi:MAG: ABC transporter ATP-binding protein [Planctomycetes bacterium]|nr:ABC transporter ATP-binding protein [Planctomycetota bacterium]
MSERPEPLILTAQNQPPPAGDQRAAPPVVDVRDLRKEYRTSEHQVTALNGVSLQIAPGRFIAIMGSSGSGKSTLLHLIGGLTNPTSGSVVVEGNDLAAMSDRERTVFRRRRLGIIFQDFNLLPTLTARENVALPRLVDGQGTADVRARVDELLAVVHLGPRAEHRPDALSGGEQQRVAIARALLNDPAIVLADEPTGNLDSRQSLEIWNLLRRIVVERGTTVIMVTHEAAGAAFADEVVVLKDGQISGRFEPGGNGDASIVSSAYQQLVG